MSMVKKTKTNQARINAFVPEPNAQPCRAGKLWRVRLLRHDLTVTDVIEIRGFRTDGTKLKIEILAANRSEISTVIRELNSRSARIPSSPQQRTDFASLLIRSTPSKAVIATSMPGFRDGTGFVQPSKMHGTARSNYVWVGDNSSGLGDHRGTLDSYKDQVLEVLVPSPLLCIGVMCALAAPLCSYVFQRTGTRLLAETMIIFFHGRTTTGKSTILRLTSSVYGLPNVGVDWAATERALAEAAYSRNDLVTLIDDTEKSEVEGHELYRRVRLAGQRIPSGETKAISKFAQKKDLPHLRWTTIGMASGPLASAVMAANAGVPLQGQAVRFLDLAVPDDGVFAFSKQRGPEKARSRSRLMERLERGLENNYGVLMDGWIEALLERDRSAAIQKRVEWFVNRYSDASDPVTQRISRKIGLLYAAGYIAQRAGLLPWPKTLPKKAAVYAYEQILAAHAKSEGALDDVIGKLRVAIDQPGAFVSKRKGGSSVLTASTLGLHNKRPEGDQWLLHPDRLQNLGILANRCAAMCEQLLTRGFILRSGNKSSTVQERVLTEEGSIKKMRFWILNVDRLRTLK